MFYNASPVFGSPHRQNRTSTTNGKKSRISMFLCFRVADKSMGASAPLRSGYKMGPFSTKRSHTGHNQVHYWTKTQWFAFLHQQERYWMHDKFQHQHFKIILNMETMMKKVSSTMVKKVSNTFWRILTVMGGPFYGRCFLPNHFRKGGGDLLAEEICQIVV